MVFVLLGLLGGLLIGWLIPVTIPIEYTRYTAVIILSIFDAVIGAVRAQMQKNEYRALIFATGLVFNCILAVGITLFGDFLGLDLYLAATVVLTFRIFKNVSAVRNLIFSKFFKTENKS